MLNHPQISNCLGPDWTSTEVSPKAWMSIRDADILEMLLLRLGQKKGAKLRVLEWGCGLSTLWYTRYLERCNISYQWLGIEHNKAFFNNEIAPHFLKQSSTVVDCDNMKGAVIHHWNGENERVVALFDHGHIAPFESQLESDRNVNMDAYVGLPKSWNFHCDIAIVDGRKRRRCLLEAQQLVGENGVVILHDAWRKHYHGSWSTFKYHRLIGDELWIGMNNKIDLSELLPWHAFIHHYDYSEAI